MFKFKSKSEVFAANSIFFKIHTILKIDVYIFDVHLICLEPLTLSTFVLLSNLPLCVDAIYGQSLVLLHLLHCLLQKLLVAIQL